MENKFVWDKEKKELRNEQHFDKVNVGGQEIDATMDKIIHYPENTVRNGMIKELERQTKDLDTQLSISRKAIENTKKKLTPVDKSFFMKFQACASWMAIKQKEAEVKNQEESRESILKQLKEVKEAMGNDY